MRGRTIHKLYSALRNADTVNKKSVPGNFQSHEMKEKGNSGHSEDILDAILIEKQEG